MQRIPLKNKDKEIIGYALVDDDDFGWLNEFSWSMTAAGYAVTGIHNKITQKTDKFYMHRIIVGAIKGDEIDHINRNKLDNRRENLRICDHSINMFNMSKRKNTNNRGVCYDKTRNKWVAQLTFRKIAILRKRYDTEEEAINAYKAAETGVLYGIR